MALAAGQTNFISPILFSISLKALTNVGKIFSGLKRAEVEK